MTDSSEALNGHLATASPKLIHLTAQRPKVKGRRLPKRQGSLTSSTGGIDQSGSGGVAPLVTDSPKLSHPTAERPKVRGRRPPKKYISPQPVENDRQDQQTLPPPASLSLEDQLVEYENTIQLIASDTPPSSATTNKYLSLRASIKTLISSTVSQLTNMAGKRENDGSSYDESEFESLASQLEVGLRRFEELLEREKGCTEEVEGQEIKDREELDADLDKVQTQIRDLTELRAVQRTLYSTQQETPQPKENAEISDPLMTTPDTDPPPPDASANDEDNDETPLISKEIRLPPREREGDSTEIVRDRMVGFDAIREPPREQEEEDRDERTPLLGDSKTSSSASEGKLCGCCTLL